MADELIFKLTVQDEGSAKISAFERQLQGLEKEASTLSGQMKTAFGNVGGYIVNFAADAAREFGKFSKESVDAFLKFETAMVAVAKTTGIPKEQLGKFSEQIRETSVDLKGLGKDAAVQIASIAEVAGQLGISADKLAKGDFEAASKEILGFSTAIAKAKIALPEFTGGVEQIATVVAKQIQLFGETPAAAEQYLSVMNKLSDTTAATAVEISSFLSKFTIAPTLKISQEAAASWGATFVSLGQNASDSATRMQSAYAMVLKGSKDTNGAINGLFEGNAKMAAQLEQLAGRSIEQAKSYSNLAREAIGKDANEAMKLFVTTLSEVESSSERAEIAFKMFGQVGARSILTLIPELPKLSDAAKEAATVFLSTNEQALDSLAKMSGVSRKEFSDNADFMKAVYAKDMPDAIRVLVEEINKIDDEQEKARVASEVFGEDWEVAMNKAEGGVKLFDEALVTAQKEIEATKNGASSIEKEYSTALDKVGTSFSELTAIMDDIKLQWGAPLAEALSAGIKLMIPVIDELRKNFMGVVEEFGRELGGEKLASAFRQTAEAFSGTIEEMGANAETFIAALKEQFTLPNLFATAAEQWNNFALLVGSAVAKLAAEAATGLKGLAADMAAAIGDAMEGMILAGIEKVKAGIEQIKRFIKDGLTGGFSDAGYKKEMENIFSAQEIGLQNVTAATQEKTAATQADLDALIALKTENLDLLRTNQDLRAEYQGVARDLGAAIESGQAPTAELTARMESLRQKIADVGVEAYGNSTFPDMTAAMMTSQAQSQALTAEMAAMQAQIKGLGAEYEATDKQIQEKQDSIRDLNTQIREQQTLLRTASEAEKEGIQNTITQIRDKKDAIQGEIYDLQELSRDQKEARKVEQDALKESIQQIKEKQKAVDELAKNTQRTAELRAKQQQEEAKAANDLYREQQKQAADSIKWVSDLDDATKKRILGEQDAVKVLQEQGVTLTDLQAQELRRMQQAYQTEAAYEAQAKALKAQLDPMGALVAAGDKLSSSLGGLSSGVGKIGDLFGFDTSGITDMVGKIQGFAELPQTIKGITDSISGIGEAFGQLKNIDLKNIFSGGAGGISGILSSLGSIAPIAGIIMSAWEPIKDFFGSLFENTKSKGTEAAEAFQQFVSSNISGGAEMASALQTNFDAMTSAGFDFQTFLQETGTTMDQTFGGISANWEQGATAMDIFTQAVGKATGDMEKAPQVALQMMASFQDMGMSAEEAGAKMIEMATAAGMSSGQIDALKAALEAATGGAAALDDELVGHSLVPSLQALNDIARVSATPLAALGAAATQTATQTAQASANVDGLKAALAGGAEEGEATGSVFDSAAQSVTTLNAQATTLSGSLSTVTTQLSGTGAAGASTSDIFAQAQASAGSLTTTTSQLSGDLSSLAGQLTGTGAETLATSNLFTLAGGSALSLQGDVNSLDGQVVTANKSLADVQAALKAIPDRKTVIFEIKQVGGIPKMATGGTVGAMGMAIVNERGSEIAKFPGGSMALMQARGPVLGAFPTGTEIIPHGQSMSLLSRFPGIPRMATGGTISGSGGTVINVNITGNNITKDTDLKALARQVSAEISRNYNAMR